MGLRGRFYPYLCILHILDCLGQDMQVLYLGRAPRTKETLPDFLKWRRVTRPPLIFRGLTGSQRTPGFWGVTVWGITLIALIDSGADLNCIQEGLIPTVYFVKTSQRLSTASNDLLKVQYKIPQGHICKNGICIKTSFLLVKNISHQIVLGTPFLIQLYPFQIDSQGLRTKYNNQEILFEFIRGIEVKEINQVQDFISFVRPEKFQFLE